MEREPKIYFAASIRGGRDDVELYRELIDYMQTFGKVLTEHIGLDSLKPSGILSKYHIISLICYLMFPWVGKPGKSFCSTGECS
jgi:hypothetical protein